MHRRSLWGYLLVLPALAILLLLVFYPIARTFVFSLYHFVLSEPDTISFIGFENYQRAFNNPELYSAAINTFTILALCLVFTLSSSICLALLLQRKNWFSPFLLGIAIIPWALPPLANGIIWKFIFHPGYGLLNKLLIQAGISDLPIPWTQDRFLVLTISALVISWRITPFCALILLANLQAIPKSLYEAASLDGCGLLRRFRHIVLPLLLPSFAIVLIQILMASVNAFDEIVSLAGYRFDSLTLVLYDYLQTFSFLDFGYGSALAYIIMILSGIIGYLYIKSSSVTGFEERS